MLMGLSADVDTLGGHNLGIGVSRPGRGLNAKSELG